MPRATKSLSVRVEAVLDDLRPFLHQDGGDVRLAEITSSKVVHLELLGNCATCPMSAMTMKNGIEKALCNSIPEIKGITVIN